MMLFAFGANIGGRTASGLVTAAVEAPGEAAAGLARRCLPVSDARAVAPRPIWQRRRKCRRVTSLEYSWWRFMASRSSRGTGILPVGGGTPPFGRYSGREQERKRSFPAIRKRSL